MQPFDDVIEFELGHAHLELEKGLNPGSSLSPILAGE
jgi:hypothetical protein